MSSTKTNIREASRFLFNTHGYSEVSIRMIAQHLGMSSGNLNYHYKTRDSILEDLYFRMVAVFDARIAELGNQEFTLESIKNDIESSMETMLEYRFFWTDLFNILSNNDRIRTHFEEAYEHRKRGYKYLFGFLVNKGILCEPAFETKYELVALQMINAGNTWIYSSQLYKSNAGYEADVRYQAFQLLSILYSDLTEEGQKSFLLMYPDFINKNPKL